MQKKNRGKSKKRRASKDEDHLSNAAVEVGAAVLADVRKRHGDFGAKVKTRKTAVERQAIEAPEKPAKFVKAKKGHDATAVKKESIEALQAKDIIVEEDSMPVKNTNSKDDKSHTKEFNVENKGERELSGPKDQSLKRDAVQNTKQSKKLKDVKTSKRSETKKHVVSDGTRKRSTVSKQHHGSANPTSNDAPPKFSPKGSRATRSRSLSKSSNSSTQTSGSAESQSSVSSKETKKKSKAKLRSERRKRAIATVTSSLSSRNEHASSSIVTGAKAFFSKVDSKAFESPGTDLLSSEDFAGYSIDVPTLAPQRATMSVKERHEFYVFKFRTRGCPRANRCDNKSCGFAHERDQLRRCPVKTCK